MIRPAAAMIAVPCWSSWNTGMSINSRSRSSMMKHSGALMSSRLMPPNAGRRKRTQLTNVVDVLGVDLEIDRVDIGKALEQRDLALHDRLARQAPRSPRPSTAVPFEITATKLPLAV